MESTLERLPTERGMRLRGLAMTRLETFVDAAFAFAVTLLVISVDDVPRTFEELLTALKNIPVFLAASAQIFVFWTAHRNWSRVYALEDGPAYVLTMLLVVSLLVMVFPLRIVYTFGASDMTGGWISPPIELDPEAQMDQLRLIFIMFGVSWAWLSGVVAAMFGYILVRGPGLELNSAERANATTYAVVFGILGFSGVSSIAIAATMPDEFVGLAGYQYLFLLFLPFIAMALNTKQRRREMPNDSTDE